MEAAPDSVVCSSDFPAPETVCTGCRDRSPALHWALFEPPVWPHRSPREATGTPAWAAGHRRTAVAAGALRPPSLSTAPLSQPGTATAAPAASEALSTCRGIQRDPPTAAINAPSTDPVFEPPQCLRAFSERRAAPAPSIRGNSTAPTAKPRQNRVHPGPSAFQPTCRSTSPPASESMRCARESAASRELHSTKNESERTR